MDLEGKKGEDMDSLFEGMVLFNPSDSHSPIEAENGCDDSLSCSQSQPLDENLFSDLTLVLDPLANSGVAEGDHDHDQDHDHDHNLQSQHASAPVTASNPSRQPPRRRKRSGLRIGYGRDPLSSNDLSPSPLHTDTVPDTDTDTLPSVATVTDAVRDGDKDTLLSVATDTDAVRDGDTDTLPSVATITDTVRDGDTDTPPSVATVTDTVRDEDTDTPSSIATVTDTQPANENPKQQENVSASSETEFSQIKASIREKLDHASQLVKSASAARKKSIRNRRKTAEDANLASLKHMQLEKQLEEACEAEDFERAEKVSENLSAAEKEKQAFTNSLREADAFVDALDLKLQHALDSQIAAEEQCAILLDHYATNALNNADSAMEKATSVYSKEMDQWLSSSEALEVKKMELEIESHFMSEARLELSNTIEHSIQDDKREKEILCKRKDVLMGELEQLLALVKQKEKEIADNDSNLEAVENKISKAVSGFKEVQSSIDVKYDKLQSVLARVKLETETLAHKKEEIDNFLIQEEEMGGRLKEFARISKEEAEGYHEIVKLRRTLMSSILKSREDKLTLTKNEEKLCEDVKLFQLDVSAARASLQELSSRKSSIQQDIASLKQRIIFIDKRVPELEAEKKVATAARNFKEAARIATEAKSLSIEKESIQINMHTATINHEKLEDEIKDTLDRLQETEGMILLKEKELAMARYQRLLLTTAIARAEKAAALEMSDMEEANLLLAEAEAADCEAEKLQSTYKFEMEDFADLQKHLISMDLVSYLDRKQLEELAMSLNLFTG
ncbi:cingulin [Abrus precatorius]|uniref:Cingulin n=1 Tax=Abrus precatorius TaxID=3816 RepID=A0A8B8LYS3_ABRPR|nr:cingulin [Abrus precatorius]